MLTEIPLWPSAYTHHDMEAQDFLFSHAADMTEVDLAKVMKVVWPATKKFARDIYTAEQMATLKQRFQKLAGSIPATRGVICSAHGCDQFVWIANPFCFNRALSVHIGHDAQEPLASCCGFLCFDHRNMECEVSAHGNERQGAGNYCLDSIISRIVADDHTRLIRLGEAMTPAAVEAAVIASKRNKVSILLSYKDHLIAIQHSMMPAFSAYLVGNDLSCTAG